MKLREMGAAHVLLESEMKGETIAKLIRDMYTNDAARTDMKRASLALGRPDACSRIVDIAVSLAKQH